MSSAQCAILIHFSLTNQSENIRLKILFRKGDPLFKISEYKIRGGIYIQSRGHTQSAAM